VTFDIDANGIVNVTAKDKATGKEQQIRIQASGGLTQADIDRMVKEAEANAEADRRRRLVIEARNQADSAVYTAEKALKDTGGRVPADTKSQVEQSIAATREAMTGEDVDRIRQAAERLVQVTGSIAEATAKAQPQGGAGEQGEPGEPGVVDAEFEESSKPDDRKTGS
jgi:molecular chaperone DnaK